jgi:hypothetical protein
LVEIFLVFRYSLCFAGVESETHPLAIPKKCPDGKFLESVLQEESTGNVSASSDSASLTSKLAVVESDLRRSKRLRDARAGFRQGSYQKKELFDVSTQV